MNNKVIPITRQCELLSLPRSSFYYKPHPVSELNLRLMEIIDRQYTKDPSSGAPRMTTWLRRQGHKVNRKRVARLMRTMGLQSVLPKKKLSRPNKEHIIYPYLLRNVDIVRPNQVFSSDITYIPMRKGFLYLTAVMDWASRYVLSWKVSLTLDAAFCIEALEEAAPLLAQKRDFVGSSFANVSLTMGYARLGAVAVAAVIALAGVWVARALHCVDPRAVGGLREFPGGIMHRGR